MRQPFHLEILHPPPTAAGAFLSSMMDAVPLNYRAMTKRLTFVALLFGAVLAHGQQPSAPPAPPAAAPAATPAPAAPEQRRHYGLRARIDGVVQYEMTEIVRTVAGVRETIVLVTDTTHGTVVLEQRSAAGVSPRYTISDVERTAFITVYARPAEKDVPAQLSVTTRGGEYRIPAADMSDWQRLRELRYSVRRELSPYLVEALERLRGTVFAVAPGTAIYEHAGRYVTYQSGTEPLAPELEEAVMPPSCSYDESFGYPCSAEQLARVTAAAEEGRLLTTY